MYIAIDIGGTNIRIGGSNSLENPSFSDIQRFESTGIYLEDLEKIGDSIKTASQGKKIKGIGCCIAGPLTSKQNALAIAPNMPDWQLKDIKGDLEDIFQCDVLLENDAAAAALGEATYGKSKGKNFTYLTWSTGFGGTQIFHINNKVFFEPFEPGHQIVEKKNARLCGCGQYGCVESYIGGKNISLYLHKAPYELSDKEWEEIENYLAQAVMNIIVIRHSQRIVFGGGIALNQPARIEHIKEIITQKLKIYPIPEIAITGYGDEIGIYGALALIAQM